MEEVIKKVEDIYYLVYDYIDDNPIMLYVIIGGVVAFILGMIGDRRFKKKRLRKLEQSMINEQVGKRVAPPEPVKMIRKNKKEEDIVTDEFENVLEKSAIVPKDNKESSEEDAKKNKDGNKKEIKEEKENNEEDEIWKL